MRIKQDKLYEKIVEEIILNSYITEKELSKKYSVSERTIRRYIKDLKDNKKIKLVINGKFRKWQIL